jgi:hypothetical protein
MAASLRWLAIVSLWAMTAACGDVTEPSEHLDDARARWRDSGPLNYTMVIRSACDECGSEMTDAVRIRVANGFPASHHYVTSGAVVNPGYAWRFPAIDDLFSRIEISIRSGGLREVRYDRALGYPTLVNTGGFPHLYEVVDLQSDED